MNRASAPPLAPARRVPALLVAVGILMIGGTLPAPLYLLWQQEVHFSEVVLTLLFAVYFPAAVIALLFFGRLSDQVGRRTVLLLGIATALASTLCLIFAHGLPLLFLGRFLSGFSVGVVLAAFTAHLSELMPGGQSEARAADISAVTQLLGLGIGPALAGIMAQYLPLPTLACFYALLALLVVAAALATATPETRREVRSRSVRPRLAMPKGKEAAFFSLAAAGFCMFAMVGLFTSLVPSVLAQRLHNANHAVAGAMSFELFLAATIAAATLTRAPPGPAILASLGLIPLGLVPLMLGIMRPALWLFVGGTALEGLAIGLGFARTLREVNRLAGDQERARVLSVYFTVTFIASMLPVIGMGLITHFANAIAADFTFACIVGLLALAALTARLTGLTAS
ncbi:MAG TPA: MFS transporter [Rhodopila sp.]|nr:MFS transporter [Rhodopila sp.]